MKAELTLWLDDELIRRVEIFAKVNEKSVAQMIADYFALFITEETHTDIQLTPTVRVLKGALCDTGIDIEDYRDRLKDKYL